MSARAALLPVLKVVVAAVFCPAPSAAEDNRLYTVPVEQAQTPKQWLAFCKRHPEDCKTDPGGATEIKLTTPAWNALVAINRNVNWSITPKTDLAHWHEADRWDYPDDGYGDCEDYALLKRRRLIQAGYPAGALMLTVVWTKQNKGHAVLLVHTDKGGFVLDSENSTVRHWTKTGYRFVKRQRAGHPNEWVYIDGDTHRPAVASVAAREPSAAPPN